ncbi:MAG: Fic family protein [bacterium]|nr:Fic family protein [bacterium]MBU0952154.1 Fic family protein [Elusimicrobiota bacterium]MBU2614249.1 Fic family protein [Elusimicrobiota bacterium]
MNTIFAEIDQLQQEINKHRPFDKHLLGQIKEYFRIGLTYTSNALEGNSLTESETKVVIEDGITIGGKPMKDHFEAIGHSEAYDFMYNLSKAKAVTEKDITKLHHLFYYRIDEANAGAYRKVKAYITGSKYPLPLPEELPKLMKTFPAKLIKLRKEKHPVEFAVLAHKELVFIHPFVDGNGRVSRLLMNTILMQEGYVVTIIPPIVRQDYISSLEKARGGNDKQFIELIAQMVKETQKDYLRLFK